MFQQNKRPSAYLQLRNVGRRLKNDNNNNKSHLLSKTPPLMIPTQLHAADVNCGVRGQAQVHLMK